MLAALLPTVRALRGTTPTVNPAPSSPSVLPTPTLQPTTPPSLSLRTALWATPSPPTSSPHARRASSARGASAGGVCGGGLASLPPSLRCPPSLCSTSVLCTQGGRTGVAAQHVGRWVRIQPVGTATRHPRPRVVVDPAPAPCSLPLPPLSNRREAVNAGALIGHPVEVRVVQHVIAKEWIR